MHIERLYVENYRSIKELDIKFSPGKNVIVGRNNVGKSNIVKALDVILGEYSPTFGRSESIKSTDFHTYKDEFGVNQYSNTIFIFCELRRQSGEELNYFDLCKCYGTYVADEKIDKEYVPECYNYIFDPEDNKSISRRFIDVKDEDKCRTEFNNKHCFAYAFLATIDDEGEIKREMRFLYREDPTHDWTLSFKANIRTELIQSAIIPSFRDPQNQLRLNKWSWYGKLMQHLTENHAHKSQLNHAFNQVKEVGDNIFLDIKEQVGNSTLKVAFPGTELHFQFNADVGPDIFKNCVLYLDDGFKSQLTDKGSGIQSATVIGLFSYFTQNVNSHTPALLIVEEPEVYLHPHARRVVSDRLDDFLAQNKNQVIVTTHSMEFMRTSLQNLNVLLVNKGEEGTNAASVKIQEYNNLFIDNNQNELFFADKVILCEGKDEFVLRHISEELFPRCLDEHNVSIISVGGKDMLAKLSKLIVKLGIKCFVLADFDFLLRDKLDERKQYEASPHESILSLDITVFQQNCIFGQQGRGAYSRLSKLRNELKRDHEKAFYTAKNKSEIEHDKIDNVLSILRKNGICILDGEIEHCSKDIRFISSSNKLSNEKVYAMKARLSSGTKMSDIFDVEQFKTFLECVFSR